MRSLIFILALVTTTTPTLFVKSFAAGPRIATNSKRNHATAVVDNSKYLNGGRSSPRFRFHTVPFSGSFRITAATTTTTTRLPMSFELPSDWESIVFHAESVANHWAGFGLQLQQESGGSGTNWITSLPILYGAGLLTSLSPCVWGLLPLTISYISAAAGERQDQQTTLPTLAFAAGLATVFCTLGVTAAQLGGVFGSSSSLSSSNDVSHLILPFLSNAICLAMGLQLLDLIRVPLPSLDFLVKPNRNKVGSSSNDLILIDGTGQIISKNKNKKNNLKEEQGSLVRTFLLGGSSALVASPCATPVLTSILAFVAKSSNPALGALLLFGYTLGYATPLLVIAATGGQALVDLRQQQDSNSSGNASWYGRLAPWVTPLTGGILLWYGTDGLLTTVWGDPSMAGLTILE
ncbi:hypothetical protein ACA910_009444 [Epithemia clementina (nom. ined.)]